MTTTLDTTPYQGRTIELSMFQGFEPSGTVLLQQALACAGGSGDVVTGNQKLVQRFVLELLTAAGTLLYEPTRGCQFMVDALTGWRTTADVTQSFVSAMVDVKRSLILEEALTDPTDERFGDATLDAVTLTNDAAALTITVTSLAGTSRVVVAPLPLTL